MSRIRTKTGWTSGRAALGALALACAWPLAAAAQQTVYWRNGAGVVNWWDGANPWYRSGDGWWIARPDYNTLYEASTIGANIVHFDNGSDLTMTVNGAYFQVHQLLFDSGTGARTMTADGSGGIDMRSGSSTMKIENNDADAQVLNVPVVLYATTEINPVSGNLTFNRTVYLKNNWINVWGNNQKTLYLNGQLNADGGTGGLAVKQDSLVVLTNDNTFAGAIWVEKGTVQVGTHTNAIGASGIVNVGTNATLDISGYGAVSVRPATLNLYGTGTNAAWGALRKTTAGATAWRGNVNLGADSRIAVTGGGLGLYGAVTAGTSTLYLSNTVTVTMYSGSSLTGSKTTGDGALHKSGSSTLYLRPAAGLTGSIWLNQGEIRQYSDNSSTIPAGGTFRMSDGTTYRSDTSTSRTNAKATQIDGNVTLGYSGGGELTLSGNVNLTAGQRTLTALNDVVVSGAITNGGLTKAGAGKMTLSGANTYALGTLVSAGVLEGTTTSLQGNVTNNAALTFNQSGNGTYAGAISGTGALTNAGAGTVTLSGTSTLSGPTTVAAGTLLVSGSVGSSAATVSGGATLAGAGTVGSIASLAGAVSPGNTAGVAATLTVNGAAALGGGSYTCDVTGTGSTDCDKIAAGGAVAAASALTINLPASAPGGFDECTAYSWTVMSGSSASAANMSVGTKWASSGTFGVSAVGNTIVVTHTPGTPSAPTGLAASDGTSTAQVALSWNDVSCETGYVVWRHTANVFASATAIYTNAANVVTYNDTAASAGQLYYYWVTATNVAGSSSESSSNSGYKRLAAPGNLAATDGASTVNVTVTWDAAAGASSYHLYRDTDSDPTGATALGPQSSGYADVAATPGQLYYYWVLASNSTSSSTSDWSTANAGYRKLATVADVAATENLTDKVTISWTDGAGETGYAIWRHTADVSNLASYVATAAADATSYDDVSASAGTDYYYWVLATNSTSASQSDWSASDYGLRLLTEPTTAASAILFGDLDTTSYTVSWTRGDGDYVLVVARQGGTPTDPTDTTVYAADATMGLGDTTAAGSYVVYKGTGTNVTVAGLSSGTEYTFAVYEFNGDASPNYRTSDEPTASRTTLVAEPTTQASGITIGTVNEVSLADIAWTDGNGSSRLLVVKAGSAVDAFPADGTSYTDSATFGSGSEIGTGNFVVYAGGSPLASLGGLTRDVVYYFRAFEFNGSGGSENYLTSAVAGNPTNQTTMAVTPGSNPTDLAVSAIGTNGFTVTWTKGTTGTNTLIVIRANGNPTDPTDLNTYAASATFGAGADLGSGSYATYAGTGSSVTVTNLAVGTAYTVEATSYNGAPGAENYRSTPTSVNASTLMPEPTQASAIAFGTLADTSYAVSYTAGGGLSRLVVAKQGSAVDWTPTDGTAYSGENNAFGSGTDLGSGNYLVHRGASPFTLSGLTTETDYHIRIFEYRGTNATLNYNVNAASGNPSNRYALSVEPTAHAATFTATALSDTQIQLDWGAATGESGFIIVRKAGSAPTGTPADGTAYSQGTALGDGTVVYVGTAAGAGSTTDSYSTAASTAYYYQIFPYAYDGTPANATYNYRTSATIPGANATTGSSEPGTSSTLVSFLPASSTSATLAWTNTGSADGSILLIKAGSAVDSHPIDWTGYSASAVFQSGDQLGTGNYVVYAAAGKTGLVTVTGLGPGTNYNAAVYPYNGSGSFLNYRTNAPGTGSLSILPAPTAQSATADGKTLIDLAWTKNGSYDVMIVYKAGSASTDPTQGAAYAAGDACGGGTVIYKGSGAALEHIVASGTTHYYAFYSYSGNYYSAGVTASDTTTAFVAGEIVETFSYTNNTALTGLNGETGWGGPWYGDTGFFTNSSGSFAEQTNYPTPSGNKLWIYPPDNTGKNAFRPLAQTYNSGKIYFSYVLNYTWGGANKYEGLSLFDTNTSEKLFIGEIYGQDQQLGIDNTGSAYTLTAGSGNDFIIAGYYDWAAGEAKAKAFKIGVVGVPVDEPASWDVTVSKASNTVGAVNTIRLAAGAGASDGTPGNTYFDEVRVATTWADLIGVLPSKPLDPTAQSATADGNEMVRLAWTTNAAGNGVMILHKTTAIATDPTDGVSYGAGDTIDGAKVVYKSTGAAVEHVVAPGTTNFYKFYSYSGASYYSTGVTAAVTNGAYASYEKVNPFSYTNGTALGSSALGGQGFGANFWAVDSGTWTIQTNYPVAVVDDVPRFMDMDGYPAMAGNRVYCSITVDGGVAKAQRSLESTISSGQFYVAFQMAYQFRGANKWAGLSLLNASGVEKAFLGKGAGANYSTLGIGDGSTTYWSAYDLGQYYSSDTYGSTGNVYLVVGKYDFDTDVFQAKAYRIVDGYTFPETEPTWDVSQTMAGVDAIARIQLNAGASVGAGYPGKVFYDEIRYATNWAGLIAVTCPTWAGSNALNGAEWAAPASTWLGDYEGFAFQSEPIGLGQSGGIEFDWARDASFSTYHDLPWLKNEGSYSYWSNQFQMVAAGVVTSRFVASGSSCTPVRTNNPALTVQNLNPPTGATATQDATYTNSQINLTWTRGVSGAAKDVIVVRQTADAGWTAPVNGTTYNASDALGSGTVVYRGGLEAFSDTGLAPDTTYYYRFYSENYTYYSTSFDEANAATATGTQEIAIDGNPADWRGFASTVLDSSASSLQEYIWTDKRGELRVDHADHPNADIEEFRVYADADWVYFLVAMTNIVDDTKPFVAIGVDTRTNSASTAMNWLGDDSGTFIGDGYAQGGAAHFPEYQINVHYVSAASGPRIELYVQGGTAWYAPATGGNTNVSISAANDVIELKVARADLNLAGAKTARFTVASLLNTGVWNNDGDGTTHIADNTAAAVDSISIPPWGTADNAANLSAWLEDIGDADIDFWVDVKFGAAGLTDNSKPSTPVLTSPTNTAAVTASPTLSWSASSDSDGQITGYLLEISTNEQFNGVTGTENGPIALRVNLYADTTSYTYTTSATQYWWRVRARDTAGELSAATTRTFRVVGKLDTEGPQPTLLYIGTNVAGYLAGDYDAYIAQYGPIQSVLDREIQDTNNVFGFVLRWEDASGVYATNHMRSTDGPPEAGGFAFNIVDTDGRVSPNWDLVEIDTVGGTTNDLWGVDRPFYASNTLATGNSDVAMTNYVVAAFAVTNYDPTIEYYLTVSAEDAYTEGGSWLAYGSWPSFTNSAAALPYYSGWCEDGPNTARNVTTNFLIRIHVTDDDIVAPEPSQALGWPSSASMVVSNAAGILDYVSGTGQDVLYQIADGALIGEPLSFSFNAYDAYYTGVALGTSETFADSGRTLTNTAFVAAYWQTNWANYDASRSLAGDTTADDTMLTWYWPSITTQDVTKLWGPDSLDGELGVTNLIQLDLFDVDNDRTGDQAFARQNFGRIVLVDDDSVDPTVVPETLAVTGTGLAREYALTNLVTWPFTGTGSERLTAAYAVVADDVVSGDFTNDTGAISGTDVITVSAGFATGASRSWIFTLAPVTTNDTIKAISLSFDSKVSSLNGPDVVEIYGTMPGGSETLWATNAIDLSDPDNPAGTNWNSYSTALAMPSASTGTVTFRLMAYVADTNHLTGTGTATWSVDSLIVSGYVLGPAGGTQITDQDLAHGTATFSLQAADVYSGIDGTIGSTGRAPRVDFWNVSQAVVPVTNAFVTNGWAATTNATLDISGAAPAAADKKQIALGAGGASLTYYARFTATDADADRDGDWRSVAYVTTNTVYDEDSSKPSRGYLYGGPLGVYVEGVLTKAVGSGNSREYRINDEQLQAVAATSIAVKVNLYDYSGWTVPTLGFSNSVAGAMSTNGWLTSVHTADVDTTNLPDATMEWRFGTNQAATLFNSYESVTNEFRVVSVWDKDDDRLDAGDNNVDNLELSSARLGYVTFLDNDVGQANVQSNWSVSRGEWRVPQVFLGLPGAAARSNLYLSGLPASTNDGTVLADLTNRVYDSQLAQISAAAPLSLVLPAFDTGGGGGGRTIKGVQRGTALTEASTNGTAHTITNSSLTIGSFAANNATNYRADLSSSLALTRIAAQFPTSVWAFTAFSYADVGTWLAAEETVSNYVMTATLYDADDNRAGDQKVRAALALGTLQVVDNDTVAPSLPANVTANGVALSGPLTRETAAWTNSPTFVVRFEPSADGEPTGTDLEKTGVAEHRVATDKADVGPDVGTPLAVPAESSLANLGFESGSTNWTLSGAVVTNEQAYEGTHALKMTGSTAYQTVPLYNTNGYVPRVTVVGVQFMGAATGTVTVTGLDAAGDPVPGETFDVSIVGTAGVWNAGSSAPTDLDATVDQVRVTLTSVADTYWDDVVVAIALYDGATPVAEVSATFTATEQGLVTNYLFAVDRDNNRAGDRKASSASTDGTIPAFGTAYDVTRPSKVPVGAASTEDVDDPTTQFDVSWNPATVGPDALDDANHPDYPSASDNDLLSPWRSYKIYYGTFDPLAVPPGDPGPGYGDAYIFTNFIDTGVYTNWLSVSSTNAIADPLGAGTNYLALTNLSQGAIRLYDLDFDQDYAVVVVGLDRAGNEGTAGPSSWATNNTIKFAVTQGVLKAFAAAPSFPAEGGTNTFTPWTAPNQRAASLYWLAAGPTNAQGTYTEVTKDYDLIYRDAGSFTELGTNVWQLAGTVRTNWFVETNALNFSRGHVRFFRASYKDRWRDTNALGQAQRPLASEEVYALHNVILSEGRNHVGLHGVPYTNTFAGVFGTDTNLWPAGVSAAAGATKVEFYSSGTNAPVSSVYFFGTDANWYLESPLTQVTTVPQAPDFFTRGLSVTLPTNLAARGFATTNAWLDYTKTNSVAAMVWHPILRVPTNGFTHTIACGKPNTSPTDPMVNMYNVVSLNLPVSVGPAQMNFPTNFKKGTPGTADHIYTIDTTTKDPRDGKIIYRADDNLWLFLDGSAVPSTYFKPNDILVIVSRNGGLGNTWEWTYHPSNFYTLPTRWMGQ